MRKRTVNHIADTIFWYLLYFFPVVAYLFFIMAEPSSGTAVISLTSFFNSLGISFFTDNPILTVLVDLFGSSGVLPLFTDVSALYFFAWFASVMLVHLAVDFILFIPRLAHKWLNAFTTRD